MVTGLRYEMLASRQAAKASSWRPSSREGSRRVHDLKPCPRSPSRAWFNGRSIDSHRVISGNGKALVSIATVAESSGFCNPQKTINDPHTTRPSNCSRLFAKNGPTPYHSKTTRSKMPGCPLTWRSISISACSQPVAVDLISRNSAGRSAELRCKTEQLSETTESLPTKHLISGRKLITSTYGHP